MLRRALPEFPPLHREAARRERARWPALARQRESPGGDDHEERPEQEPDEESSVTGHRPVGIGASQHCSEPVPGAAAVICYRHCASEAGVIVAACAKPATTRTVAGSIATRVKSPSSNSPDISAKR